MKKWDLLKMGNYHHKATAFFSMPASLPCQSLATAGHGYRKRYKFSALSDYPARPACPVKSESHFTGVKFHKKSEADLTGVASAKT
jgi:hypothetical protein